MIWAALIAATLLAIVATNRHNATKQWRRAARDWERLYDQSRKNSREWERLPKRRHEVIALEGWGRRLVPLPRGQSPKQEETMALYSKEVTSLRIEAGTLVGKAYAAGWRAGYEQARQQLIDNMINAASGKKIRRRRRKAGK